jgi:hypothetical protein
MVTSGSSQSRYVVISADTHGGVKPAGYRDYLDREFRDDFDDWLENVYPGMEKGFYETVEQNTKSWGVDRRPRRTDRRGAWHPA